MIFLQSGYKLPWPPMLPHPPELVSSTTKDLQRLPLTYDACTIDSNTQYTSYYANCICLITFTLVGGLNFKRLFADGPPTELFLGTSGESDAIKEKRK